ncbi:hypothetical protein SASPL_156631 [Salvia splendens]|uniref:Uncharacterized protein n=1 Tax=Salvia splendens TaxID=180675 RepID=A0A8X8YVM8_SALSN|nr:hypothetical protein SASPL_156631 [Salvia splendens]
MAEGGMSSSPYSIISEGAGVAGNICAFVLFSDIQEDHQKQINRAILRAALHLRPLELLDMPLVWHTGCLSRLDLDRHCQHNRSPFPARLHPHIHSLCRPQEKAEGGGIVVGSFCCVCCHCLY